MNEKLPKVVRVHETTVQKAAREPPKRRRRRSPRKDGAVEATLTTVTVRRDVWAEARRLAKHPSHIQIINEREVIVWNHGPPWPTMTGVRP